tara:strand:- start:101 stop:352 length:252 start_codon:yes stop_codon:yes gene_type:complete
MKKTYEIKDLDYNEISFIEQSLKRHISYYEDINVRKPNDKLYKDALKTVSKLFSKVNEIRKSKGEKPQVKMSMVNQKQFEEGL